MSQEVSKDNNTVKSIENFTKTALPMLRKNFGENLVNELIGVQPMQSPSGNVFAMNRKQAEKVEYEDVYEKLPESDENSIQVGEGWGPRLIGKRNKITGVMVIDFRENIRRKMEEDRQEEEKFSLANFEKQFVKKLFTDIS